jgi:NAD(P)-dependent dehydrogenase (short-subunit alcohol dehydrogenase family)
MTQPIVLITGAAGGLGGALTLELAQAGCDLLLLDKNSRGLDRVSDLVTASGLPEPAVCPLDLASADPEAYLELAGILEREFGGVDHVVHGAAHLSGLTPMDQVAPGEWMTAMQVNLTAAWAMTAACLPLLRRSSNASVTFVLDDRARTRSAFWGPYGVAKAALKSLAEILGEELETSGVRIETFNPGPMRTTLRATAYLAEDPESQPDPAEAARTLARAIIQAETAAPS